jgi:hypothetical protein
MTQVRLTADDMVASVRAITDTDTTDVTDAVIKLYLRDGFNRIIDLERRWNFLEVTFSFTTVVNQSAYTIDNYTTYDMREVISIVDADNARLEYIGYDVAEEEFLVTGPTSGDPLFFSMWANQIHIFPTPNAAIPLVVRGYRIPDDWVTAGTTTPDCPVQFDIPLVYYAISRIYQSQEEVQTAAVYNNSFAEAISVARKDLVRAPSATPVVFAGGKSVRRFKGSDW